MMCMPHKAVAHALQEYVYSGGWMSINVDLPILSFCLYVSSMSTLIVTNISRKGSLLSSTMPMANLVLGLRGNTVAAENLKLYFPSLQTL